MIIGTRGSALALAQTGWVREQILSRFPGLDLKVKVIKTSADRNPTTSIRSASLVGVFVKELEQALLENEIDIAVHSMKDVPTALSPGLRISAIPEREDARDAFIGRKAKMLSELPAAAVIGTGSIRRQAQLLALRPDLTIVDIRGNVDTRLKKLQEGAYDAVILACAGLNRLGLQDRISTPLEFSEMLPAPGQAALAVETRDEDARAVEVTSALNHAPTALAISAERRFLELMGGGCNIPVAAYARLDQDSIQIHALVASPDGKKIIRDSVRRNAEETIEAVESLAAGILGQGGRGILDQLE